MNKLLFLFLTTLCLIILIFASNIVGSKYILSDYYVPTEMFQSEDGLESDRSIMSRNEYVEYIQRGEDPGIEDFSELPIELQYVQAKSFLLQIFSFVIILTLSIFAGFIIKDNKIDFSVMVLDTSEKRINMVRIGLYVAVLMTAYITTQTYPLKYLLGWLPTVLWMITNLMLMVWILNIIYAMRERKQYKNKTLKPSGSL